MQMTTSVVECLW